MTFVIQALETLSLRARPARVSPSRPSANEPSRPFRASDLGALGCTCGYAWIAVSLCRFALCAAVALVAAGFPQEVGGVSWRIRPYWR